MCQILQCLKPIANASWKTTWRTPRWRHCGRPLRLIGTRASQPSRLDKLAIARSSSRMETRWAGAGASIRHEAIGPEPEECVEQGLNSATGVADTEQTGCGLPHPRNLIWACRSGIPNRKDYECSRQSIRQFLASCAPPRNIDLLVN